VTPRGRRVGKPLRPRGEQGSATVVAAGLAGAVVACCLVAAALAGLVSAQHRAAAAADLAALTGARTPEQGCQVARRVAADNGAHVARCEVTGAVVTLTVRLRVEAPLGLRPTIEAEARAGPRSARALRRHKRPGTASAGVMGTSLP
jgi:secretion/DNA translocation related TadE-like protein